MSQTANVSPANLANFYGTEGYTRHWTKRIVLTDGIVFLEANGCAWFVDIVASHQINPKVRAQEFQTWFLRPLNGPKFMAEAVCEDGNGNIVLTQQIEFTDFPFDRFKEDPFKVYVEKGSVDGKKEDWICMLPGER